MKAARGLSYASRAACAALVACDGVFGLAPPDAIDAPAELVARYRFESTGPVIVDETGRHHGRVPEGALTPTQGRFGNAIELSGVDPKPYVVVDDSPMFDLAIGSIELWVRPTDLIGTNGPGGILSRDNNGTSDGHLVLVQMDTFFFARLQLASDDGVTRKSLILCSTQSPIPNQWMHLGINLGPPRAELWVDGVLGSRVETFTALGGTNECSQVDEPRALVGNDDPWVLGALGVQASPGTADLVVRQLTGGAIDELVIRSVRRDFSQP